MVVFTAASIACGPRPRWRCCSPPGCSRASRAALLLPSSLALVRLAYDDPRARAKAIAIWAAIGGVALAAGPVVGGVLTSAVDWRAIFFLNFPVGVLAVLADRARRRAPRKRTPSTSPARRRRSSRSARSPSP